MMNPLPPSLVLACNRGPIAIGRFEKPEFHKEEGENLLSKFDIDIEYGEPIDYGKGTALSDFEHARLIETYVDHACRVRDTARVLKRSPHTITSHVEDHTQGVLREGSCERCKRVGGREVSNTLTNCVCGTYLQKDTTTSAL